MRRTVISIIVLLAVVLATSGQRRVTMVKRVRNYSTTSASGTYGVAALRTWTGYYPTVADLSQQPIAVFVHGGGWTGGDKATDGVWTAIGQSLAEIGFVSYSINYTKATASSATWYPAPEQDIRSFLGYLGAGNGMGGNVNKITLWGNSSGAHLSLVVALAPKATFAESENPGTNYTVVAAFNNCGPVNLVTMYTTCPGLNCQGPIEDHLGGTPAAKPTEAAGASADTYVDVNSIPVYLQIGTTDILIPTSQATDLAATYAAATNSRMSYTIYTGVGHTNDAMWNAVGTVADQARKVFLDLYSR